MTSIVARVKISSRDAVRGRPTKCHKGCVSAKAYAANDENLEEKGYARGRGIHVERPFQRFFPGNELVHFFFTSGGTTNRLLAPQVRMTVLEIDEMYRPALTIVKAGRICGARGYDTINGDQYSRTLLIGCKSPATAQK
jgi:hypothetical protein